MTKTFDGIKDGKHVEIWTPTSEDIEKAKKRKAELQEQMKKKTQQKNS